MSQSELPGVVGFGGYHNRGESEEAEGDDDQLDHLKIFGEF
jgi:hypothetical protein